MKPLYWLMMCLVFSKVSFTQDTSFIVGAGARPGEIIPAKDIYQYPAFLRGNVFFRDGTVSEGKMNYNRLTDEMLFVDQNGDTLAIDNKPTIRFIWIEKDSFYFDQGYIRLLKGGTVVKLGVKEGFKPGDKRKQAGYDMMSSASSVSSFSSLYDGKRMYPLEVKEQTIVFKTTLYYFGDRYHHFVLATKKNLVALFPNYSVQLNRFCNKNKVDFSSRRDLERVVSFLASISL